MRSGYPIDKDIAAGLPKVPPGPGPGSDIVVHGPPSQHHCGPNKYGFWYAHWNDEAGTVRRCECGRYWVAVKGDDPGYMGVLWRIEAWIARWRRERRWR